MISRLSNIFIISVILILAFPGKGFAQLNGTFTIGGITPDYSTINNAVNDLTAQGVSGPVIFQIRPGTFTEQITIPAISGASSINTITFQSEQLDTASVIIRYNGIISTENFVLRLDGADFIRFRYVTLARITTGSYGGRVIVLENGACNNQIEFCHITGKKLSQSLLYEAIYSSISVDSSNTISDNLIERAGEAVYMSGLDTAHAEFNNRFERNRVTDIASGIILDYQNNVLVNENNISLSYYSEYCILLHHCGRNVRVIRNLITTISASGIGLSDCDAPLSDSVVIANNMLNVNGYNSIWVDQTSRIYILNNSVRNYGSAYNAVTFTNSTLFVYNNIFSQFSNGVAMYLNTSTIFSDYNDFYTGGGTLIKYGLNNYTLQNWQSTWFQDYHSTATLPAFISSTDLHVESDINLNASALPVSFITNDFDGDIRSSTPDIGADEFDHPQLDAGAIAVFNPPLITCAGVTEILVDVRNYGELDLNSIVINWMVNDELQSSVLWLGTLGSGDTASSVSLGMFDIQQDSIYVFKIWTTLINGLEDTITANGTIAYGPVVTKMAGVYTIGGVNPGFAGFAESVAALIDRTICDDVIFNVRPGWYKEVISIPKITGASETSWVTWQSENLDTSSAVLYYDDDDFSPYHVVELDDACFIKFRYLQIRRIDDNMGGNMGLVSNSPGANKLSHIVFEHCYLRGAHPWYLGTFVVFGDVSNLWLLNNTFEMASEMVSIGGADVAGDSNIFVIGNCFRNAGMHSLSIGPFYPSYYDSVVVAGNLFCNDTIGLPDLGPSPFGFTCSKLNKHTYIYDNRFDGRFAMALGIAGIVGTATEPVVVYNNFIACINGSANGSEVVEINGSVYVSFIHNSIRVYNFLTSPWSSTNNHAIRFYTSDHLNISNNIFQMDSANTVFNFTSDWNTKLAGFDYNNFYWEDSSVQFCNCSNWPAGFNTHSLQLNPYYISPGNLHIQNPALAVGTATPVLTDIDGQLRADPPCIGADELPPFDIGIVNPATELVNCDSLFLSADIFNIGTDTIQYFEVYETINGFPADTLYWSGILEPGDTLHDLQIGAVDFFPADFEFLLIAAYPDSVPDLNQINDSVKFSFNYAELSVDLGSDTSVCPGSFVLLSTGGNFFTDYLWSTGDTLESIVADSGFYYVMVKDSSGCVYNDSIVVSWFLTDVPAISLVNDTVYSSLPNGNQWLLNNIVIAGATADFYAPSLTGYYSVLHTDINGCVTKSDSIYFLATAIIEASSLSDIIVYPNPATGLFAVSTGSEFITGISLNDVNGRRVKTFELSDPGNYFFIGDLSSIPGGIYLLQIVTAINKYQVKVVVLK